MERIEKFIAVNALVQAIFSVINEPYNSQGIETDSDIAQRKAFLRQIGYKSYEPVPARCRTARDRT